VTNEMLGDNDQSFAKIDKDFPLWEWPNMGIYHFLVDEIHKFFSKENC
jgi:hypothetical protein